MKFAEIKNLETPELRKRLEGARQSLFTAKMKHRMKQLSNAMELRTYRRDIARLEFALSLKPVVSSVKAGAVADRPTVTEDAGKKGMALPDTSVAKDSAAGKRQVALKKPPAPAGAKKVYKAWKKAKKTGIPKGKALPKAAGGSPATPGKSMATKTGKSPATTGKKLQADTGRVQKQSPGKIKVESAKKDIKTPAAGNVKKTGMVERVGRLFGWGKKK